MGRLILFTGAGLSVESGVPLYRGGSGLWDNYRLDQVCNMLTWKSNFNLVHEFYNKRRAELTTVQPNLMHQAIAGWSKLYETVSLTQNVDDLLERAGCEDVIHVHGRLTEMRCTACGGVFDVGYSAWDPTVDTCRNPNRPDCVCRKGIKPNVVFFNETAPEYARLFSTLGSLTDSDVVVVIGTSGQVLPIDQYLSGAKGYKVLVNLDDLTWDCWDVKLLKPAKQAIQEVDDILRERLG
jgi:NAD-dependent deacetylase